LSNDAENVRRAYEAYADGDVQPLLALIDPECEIQDVPSIPDPEVHLGPAGFLRSQSKFSEVFDELRLEPMDVVDTDSGVLVLAVARGVDRRSGREIEARVAALWSMRDGKAIRGVYFDDWERAQRSSGRRS
jgi:ketosteroid isomerase-like protein